MVNSANPDQLEAHWSGSELFAKARYIQVQQNYRVNLNQRGRNRQSEIERQTEILSAVFTNMWS